MELDGKSGELIQRDFLPLCLTCGFHDDIQSADLSAEEEALMDRVVSVTIDFSGRLIGSVPGALYFIIFKNVNSKSGMYSL